MRGAIFLVFMGVANTAWAHPGHWADVAGHDHWAAGAAIGLAGLAALCGVLKGKKAQQDVEEAKDEPELEEEAA